MATKTRMLKKKIKNNDKKNVLIYYMYTFKYKYYITKMLQMGGCLSQFVSCPMHYDVNCFFLN